ncbi:MAG TPA: hypothetical protein VJB61_09515 [Actinomycetota bacterium]
MLSRRRLAPATLTGVVAGDRLVPLRTAVDGIRAAGLLVVDAHGGIRTVELDRVQAGFQGPRDWDSPGAYAVSRDAGLAVDPGGGRAFVVAAGPTVAGVDLATCTAPTANCASRYRCCGGGPTGWSRRPRPSWPPGPGGPAAGLRRHLGRRGPARAGERADRVCAGRPPGPAPAG